MGVNKKPQSRSNDNSSQKKDKIDISPLTDNGIKLLVKSQKAKEQEKEPIKVQLLGIYRYLVDPEANEILSSAGVLSIQNNKTLFDLVISDGKFRLKCVLSPHLNHLVWRHVFKPLSIIEITKYHLHRIGQRKICIVQEMALISRDETTEFIIEDASSCSSKSPEQDTDLTVMEGENLTTKFLLSSDHLRDISPLPLLGQRQYYLPIWNDEYIEDVVMYEEDLIVHHPDFQFLWNRQRTPLTKFFREDVDQIHTLEEVDRICEEELAHTGSVNKCLQPTNAFLVGVIQYKSKLFHLGQISQANPLPFMFHVILADAHTKMEVAFFGTSCARHFYRLIEGDVVQMRGFSFTFSSTHNTQTATRMYFYPDGSKGSVLHVPRSFYRMLQMTNVLRVPPHTITTSMDASKKESMLQYQFLQCNFLTTLELEYWHERKSTDIQEYFDVVAVISYASEIICEYDDQEEKRETIVSYRWIKVIDSSSSIEIVIKIFDQANTYRSCKTLQAGDRILLTKLQAVLLKQQQDNLEYLKYAQTSVYSRIYLNRQLKKFQLFHETCLQLHFFSEQLLGDGRILRQTNRNGESWLIQANDEPLLAYSPMYTQEEMDKSTKKLTLTSQQLVAEPINRRLQALRLHETFEFCVHGFVERLLYYDTDEDDEDELQICIEFDIHGLSSTRCTAVLKPSRLYKRRQKMPTSTIPKECQVLYEMLPLVILDRIKEQPISLQQIESILIDVDTAFVFTLRGIRHSFDQVELILEKIVL